MMRLLFKPGLNDAVTFTQGKSVEDIISEWDAELVKRSQSFTEHANALADWDRIILKNRQVLLDVEEHLCQVPFPNPP